MAIRIRIVDGVTIALCATETDPQEGDTYLDDTVHHALAVKFASDWQGETVDWVHDIEWHLMESEKLRDAQQSFSDADYI